MRRCVFRKRIDQLGSLQTAVMDAIWASGEATVQHVLEQIDRDPPPAYTTVLTVMQKLTKAGWLVARKEGRAHVYRAARSRDQEDRSALQSFVHQVFSGDAMLALQRLINDTDLDPRELDELQALIQAKREEADDA